MANLQRILLIIAVEAEGFGKKEVYSYIKYHLLNFNTKTEKMYNLSILGQAYN